jgi:YVTN family beta-propeller protein
LKTISIIFIILFLFSAPLRVVGSDSESNPPENDLPGIREKHPRSIAINPYTNKAVIACETAGSVSVVDLNTRAVISTIPVGKRPKGIAIDGELNLGLVCCNEENVVAVIDLNTYRASDRIPVGGSPEGIAIHHPSYVAVVANYKDDAVSIIDLMSYRIVKTIATGKGPIAVAIDPELDLALVANHEDTHVAVIDLEDYKVTRVIPVEKGASVIRVDPGSHLAVVAGGNDDSVALIDLVSWESRTIRVGKMIADVALNPFGNRALVMPDGERSLFLLNLEDGTVEKSYPLEKEPRGIAVNRFTNVAAVVNEDLAGLLLAQLPHPVPEITSIRPPSILGGNGPARLKIEGSKFTRVSKVSLLDSVPLEARFIDDRHLQALLPESLLTEARTYRVVVTNPGPEGGSSFPFAVHVNNPKPRLINSDQEWTTGAEPGLTLVVNGAGFNKDTAAFVNEIPTDFILVDKNRIRIRLPGEDLFPGRWLEIMVSNSSPGGGASNRLTVSVSNPIPSRLESAVEPLPEIEPHRAQTANRLQD